MKYRKLRIVWSVALGLLAVLLCVLWVRSYWRNDDVTVRVAKYTGIEFNSRGGRFVTSYFVNDQPLGKQLSLWIYPENNGDFVDQDGKDLFAGVGFNLAHWANGRGIILPHWFLVLAFGVLAGAAWPRGANMRFSLRTLLIVTTLVAVGLELLVWAMK